MLKIFRKKIVTKIILWIVAVIIIISFGFFGTAYVLTSQQTSAAGKIFNKKISLTEFRQAYQAVYTNAFIRYGDKFREIAPYLDFEKETWDRLILLEEARKRRISVSDKEVVDTIRQFPFFERSGQFDHLLYNTILQSIFRTTPQNFEQGIRDNLKIAQLFKQETASLTINDAEIFEAYKARNEKVQVSYLLVSADQFNNAVSVDEAAVEDYYEKHKEEFFEPPSINTEYLFLAFPADQDEAKVNIRQKAQTIYEDLLKDPDLKKIALVNNLEIQHSGFFSQEEPNLNLGWPFSLLAKVFELNVNAIAEPMETDQGIYIVRVIERKEAHVPDYNQVKAKALNILSRLKAKALAKVKAKDYLESMKEKLKSKTGDNFVKIAQDLGLHLNQTPIFHRGQYLPEIGIAKDFEEAAFGLTEKDPVSDVVETEKGFCILHLDNYLGVNQNDFEKEKDKAAQDILTQKQDDAFNGFITRLRLKANLQNNLPEQTN